MNFFKPGGIVPMKTLDDKLIIVSENRINQLVKMEQELLAAREVIAYFREWNGHSDECDRSPCDCGYSEDLEVLKKYDEARQG
jgi:hypothetical protein